MNNQDNKKSTFDSLFDEEQTDLFEYEGIISDQDNEENPDDENSENSENPEDQKKKLTKKQKILLITGGVIGLLLLIYIIGIFYFMNRFIPGTYVNGVNIGFKTDKEAVNTLNNTVIQREVTIVGENNQMNKVTGGEIGLEFIDVTQLSKLLAKQNKFAWPFDALIPSMNDFNTAYSFNHDMLTSTIDNLSLVSGKDVIQPQNAQFTYNGQDFTIQPAIPGTKPNIPKLEDAIENALVNNIKTINLKEDNLYQEAELTENSPLMQKNLERLNTAIQASITINFPNSPVTLNKDTFNTWLVADTDGVSINPTPLNNYVANLAGQFNTRGRNYNFRARNGNTYTFTNNNGGYILNQEGMAGELNSQIIAGEKTSDDPIWAQASGAYISGNQITGNYIEVSLASQSLWLYKNNTMVGSSTIVSGDPNINRATSTGLYFIKSKNLNANMTVRLPDGNLTNTQVNYWFPYTDTIGIESAHWRNQFGNNIYVNQGTDGDIDVPVDMGQTLNNNIDVNYPVVIY